MRSSLATLAFCAASAALPALAQQPTQAPPIKPGLWVLKSTTVIDGGQPVDVSAHLKNLPPDVRKQMESAMREKGIDMGAGDGSLRVCLSREAIDQGTWQGSQSGCQVDFTSRTTASWKWRAVCAQPPSESIGEAIFHNPEAYTVNTTSKSTSASMAGTVQASIDAKWQGNDCGNLKPIQQPAPAR